jgi:hypothetical protein
MNENPKAKSMDTIRLYQPDRVKINRGRTGEKFIQVFIRKAVR